jgi:N-methylhydantoinase B/oxoprolinase/acetone carboxylase alpha subunit
MPAGDRIQINTPGGGGYWAPGELEQQQQQQQQASSAAGQQAALPAERGSVSHYRHLQETA